MSMDAKIIEQLGQRVSDARAYLHIDDKEAELAKLDEETAQPGFWDDTAHAQSVSKRAGNLRDTIREYGEAVSLFDDAQTALELADEDDAFADEAAAACAKLETLLDSLELASWFTGQFDEGDAILTVNPGQGGLEANDWADMLFKMYSHYGEIKGWKVHVLDITYAEGIGIDRATIQFEGRNAYGMLRSEIGVHRLVRISPTDAKARRHTTFASVELLPVLPDDIEVDLDPNDVRVDVFRASRAPGA